MIYIIVGCILILILFCKLTVGWCNSKICLVGKTAIITGGNSGIGYEIALALASRGCKIIIADKDDASGSKHKIIAETENKNIFTKKMDLSSLDSVRKFVEYIKQTEPKIDILINNAGIGSTAMRYTEDGLHRTIQVNYLGHFLLTYLLLDLLKKSAPSRIIFTSSIAAFFAQLKLEDLNPRENEPKPYRTYPNSKLADAIATRYLSEKLRRSNVTVNCFHPGAVKSAIFLKAFKDEWSIFPFVLGILTLLFGKSTEGGAQTAIYLSTEKTLNNVTGKFFMDCCKFLMPYQVYNLEFCKDVFEYSKKLVRLKPEECSI